MNLKNYQTIILLFLISFVVLFNPLFEEVIHDHVANLFFKYLGDNVKNGYSSYFIIIGLSVGIYIYYLQKTYKQVVIPWFQVLLYAIIAAIYVAYRCHFKFTPKYSYILYPQDYFIKYTDIIFSVLFCIIITRFALFIKNKRKNISDKNIGFITDFSNKDDKLKRSKYAESIAANIKNAKNKENALALGIVGKWGSGKSFFMKEIEKLLKKDKELIIINFNPWYSRTPAALTKDFFDVLKEALMPYDMRMKHQLDDYVQKVATIEDVYAQILKVFISEQSNEAQFEAIKKSILAIDKKIVVFIDDLDRLDKQEIIEVIRIIRNTAAFPNFVYVVTYDKGYVNEALKELNPYQASNFLEKIFQVEITLPEYEEGILENMLTNELLQKLEIKHELTGENKEEIKRVIQASMILKDFVQNPRDIIRFVNIFCLDYETLHNKVDTNDFFHLTLFKFKFPHVYEAFAREYSRGYPKKNILEDDIKQNPRNKNAEIHREKSGVNTDEKKRNEERLVKMFNLQEIDAQKLIKLSQNYFVAYDDVNYSRYSIHTHSNRKRYFAYRIPDGDIDPVVLSDLRKKYQETDKVEVFREELITYQEEYKITKYDLLKTLCEISYNEYDNRLDFENVIATIIYLMKNKEDDNISIERYEEYLSKIIHIPDIQNKILDLYKRDSASINDLTNFLEKNIFSDLTISFKWVIKFCSNYDFCLRNYKSHNDVLFKESEIVEKQEQIFGW